MRLWSIHPCYLDTKGLLAVWREGLLAKNVLEGHTRGYKHHPQLIRFKNYENPTAAIHAFLSQIHIEATRRGYHFNPNKIIKHNLFHAIPVTKGQVMFEFCHLLNKLKTRDPQKYKEIVSIKMPVVNPLFSLVEGDIESWEKL